MKNPPKTPFPPDAFLATDVSTAPPPRPPLVQQRTGVDQVKETLKHPLLLLLIGSVLSSFLIPWISSRLTEAKLLQEARLKKALEIGDHNREFNSKVSTLKTYMQTFNNQNVRMNLPPAELREAQKEFRKNYTERYLALDEIAWWWYGDIEREAYVLKLASPENLKQLDAEIREYGLSTAKTVGALTRLWRHLSSDKYSLEKASQDEIKLLEEQADKVVTEENEARRQLVEKIGRIFQEP